MKDHLRKIYLRLFDRFGPQSWWPGETPFEVAVGAILTQNTNWTNVEKAIANLKSHRCLSPGRIRMLSERKLAELIRPSGYFNQKARRLKDFVHHLEANYGGSMAAMARSGQNELRQELLHLKGIGPETADSILLYALNKPFFVIDAYTKRVLTRHGFVDEQATYHEMQELFHVHLERELSLYNEYHALFVRLCKEHCAKRLPLCEGCPLETFPHTV